MCFRSTRLKRQNPDLRWGWVSLERTRILNGIQFTTHFVEILLWKRKQFVGSFVHVILTRHTFGQRSSRAAESKRQALGNYFSERICYMFLISKCRGDRDLGLCTPSDLRLENRRAMAKSGKNLFRRRKNQILPQCVCVLYILISGTYSKFARKNSVLALGVCFPQPCSSAGRRYAASRSRVQNYRRIVSFPE